MDLFLGSSSAAGAEEDREEADEDEADQSESDVKDHHGDGDTAQITGNSWDAV